MSNLFCLRLERSPACITQLPFITYTRLRVVIGLIEEGLDHDVGTLRRNSGSIETVLGNVHLVILVDELDVEVISTIHRHGIFTANGIEPVTLICILRQYPLCGVAEIDDFEGLVFLQLYITQHILGPLGLQGIVRAVEASLAIDD